MAPRLFVVALALLFAALPVRAQTIADVVAVAYRDLPAGTALRLRLLDDSDLNLQVRDMVAGQLTGAGYSISDDAAFVLQIETETVSDAAVDPSLGSFQAGTEGSEVRLNLWSSREDSLLQRRRDGTSSALVYRISLGLYDERDGRYYWRGTASGLLEQTDAAGASREMVPLLLAHFGKTARQSTPE